LAWAPPGLQYAALPYRLGEAGEIEILLVTSREGTDPRVVSLQRLLGTGIFGGFRRARARGLTRSSYIVQSALKEKAVSR